MNEDIEEKEEREMSIAESRVVVFCNKVPRKPTEVAIKLNYSISYAYMLLGFMAAKGYLRKMKSHKTSLYITSSPDIYQRAVKTLDDYHDINNRIIKEKTEKTKSEEETNKEGE